jgi:hypothetical protein
MNFSALASKIALIFKAINNLSITSSNINNEYVPSVSIDLGINAMVILKWILNGVGRCELDPPASGKGPVGGPCEHSNEPSGSIKGGEFLD